MSWTKIEKRPPLLKLLTNIGVEANQQKWPAAVSVRPARKVRSTFVLEPLVLQSLKLLPLVLHSLLLQASSVTATSIEAVKAGEEKRQIEQFPRQRMTNAELRDRWANTLFAKPGGKQPTTKATEHCIVSLHFQFPLSRNMISFFLQHIVQPSYAHWTFLYVSKWLR